MVCAGVAVARLLRGKGESAPPSSAAQPSAALDTGQVKAQSQGPDAWPSEQELATGGTPSGNERSNGRRDVAAAQEPAPLGLEEGGAAHAQVLLPNWKAKYAERTAGQLEQALNALRLELADLARAASRGAESARLQHAELQAEARWLSERLGALRATPLPQAPQDSDAR
jgi:hypothetical protein